MGFLDFPLSNETQYMDNYNGGKLWDIMCYIRDNPVGFCVI